MEYIYFILGIVLGVAITIYFNEGRKEKISAQLKKNSKMFLTERLNLALDRSIQTILERRQDLKRDLTDEEKDEIIFGNYKREKTDYNAK